ncbi:MAG TPA: hypothetical protein PK142_00735 [bacterium]|nr:hypothetical protein [bacterium]
MKDFFKTIILVAIFYSLIVFSFLWFNKGEKDFRSIPYVQEFFLIVTYLSENISENSIDNWDVFHLLDRESRESENLLPNSSEGWESYLNN